MVLLLAALTVHGFIPGPQMVSKAPHLFYAAIARMLASTIFLVLTGWRMATLMLAAVNLNRQAVIVIALAMTLLGVYALNTRILDIFVCIAFGGVGYFMLRYGYSTAAAALAVFLGKEFERNLRIGLNYNDGSFFQFFTRPITAIILTLTIALFAIGIYRQAKFRRAARRREQEV